MARPWATPGARPPSRDRPSPAPATATGSTIWSRRRTTTPVHGGFAAGEITDDTQQAFALAQVLIDDGCISVEGAARSIVAWYDKIDGDNSPYVGPSTRRAVEALKQGADPHETGRHGDTNGGAMRISPIGLIHPGEPDAAIADAIVACTPSHFTDVALSGGVCRGGSGGPRAEQ